MRGLFESAEPNVQRSVFDVRKPRRVGDVLRVGGASRFAFGEGAQFVELVFRDESVDALSERGETFRRRRVVEVGDATPDGRERLPQPLVEREIAARSKKRGATGAVKFGAFAFRNVEEFFEVGFRRFVAFVSTLRNRRDFNTLAQTERAAQVERRFRFFFGEKFGEKGFRRFGVVRSQSGDSAIWRLAQAVAAATRAETEPIGAGFNFSP